MNLLVKCLNADSSVGEGFVEPNGMHTTRGQWCSKDLGKVFFASLGARSKDGLRNATYVKVQEKLIKALQQFQDLHSVVKWRWSREGKGREAHVLRRILYDYDINTTVERTGNNSKD